MENRREKESFFLYLSDGLQRGKKNHCRNQNTLGKIFRRSETHLYFHRQSFRMFEVIKLNKPKMVDGGQRGWTGERETEGYEE